ncbi:transcription initiation factor IIE2 [Heterostelium album PN500]|uniref:Transcription initiation factor IIE subunit beta n=1 Tax=Heterostelium pallidum (strain ATCC 26659 / Pp 5 / PN500) TaxID=670386 RepID=D3B549_HETP5|nr:transcription initiation factor IIE2 [Heterostelium album PN500]EFA83414.1 transcription initiation factor IIE2 [Heterostelium album PN500]|eukprot:XP_020435531.1 transcription initiation factor IIE2 [Heterostelium album PN500]
MDTKSLHLRALENLEKHKKQDEAKPSFLSSHKRPISNSLASKPMYLSTTIAMQNKNKPSITRMVYDIVNHLKSLEGSYITFEELRDSTGHEIYGNQELIDQLKTNIKVEFLNDTTLCYKPLHNVKDDRGILELLSKHPYGIMLSDLKESYLAVEQDVKKLKDSKEIYAVRNSESNSEMLFYSDEKYRIPCSSDLVDLWKSVVMPKEVDLEQTMKDAGLSMVESSEAAKTIQAKKVEKKDKKRRITKVTNSHIADFDPNA